MRASCARRQALPPIDWIVVDATRMGAQRMVNKDKMERAIRQPEQTHSAFALRPVSTNVFYFANCFPAALTHADLKGYRRQNSSISSECKPARQECADLMKG